MMFGPLRLGRAFLSESERRSLVPTRGVAAFAIGICVLVACASGEVNTVPGADGEFGAGDAGDAGPAGLEAEAEVDGDIEIGGDEGPSPDADIDAVDYVRRIVEFRSPEVMHATEAVRDPSDWEYQLVAFDDSALLPGIEEIQRLEFNDGPLSVSADLSYGNGIAGSGCVQGDFVHCRVVLANPSGRQVATALVDYLGNGVTGLLVEVVGGDVGGTPQDLAGGAGNILDVVGAVDLTGCGRVFPLADEDEVLINHPVPFPLDQACVDVLQQILTELNFDDSVLSDLVVNPRVVAIQNRSGDLAVVSVAGAQGFRNIIISTPELVADYERWNRDRG